MSRESHPLLHWQPSRIPRLAAMVWCISIVSILPAIAGPFNLTGTTTLDERAPRADSSGRAVWSAWDGKDYEVYRWDPATNSVTAVTVNDGIDDRYPQIASNGTVVWMRYENVGGTLSWNVYRRALTGSETAVATGTADDLFPRINASHRVVWARPATSGNYDLWVRNSTGSEAAVTTDGSVLLDPDSEDHDFQINNSGHVVWVAWDGTDSEIRRWDGTTTTAITNNSSADDAPQINTNGKIVWQGWSTSSLSWDLYRWDSGSGTVTLTQDPNDDVLPQHNTSDQVVWMRRTGFGWEIIRNSGGAETQLTTNHLDDLLPTINATGGVSWLRENGSALMDVFYWNTSTTQLVATNAAFDAPPQLDNFNRTHFLGHDGTSWEIYRYVRAALTAVTFTAPTIVRGSATTGAVFLLSAAPAGGALVTLTSSDPAVASVPATVTVPAGQASATFPVTAGALTATSRAVITAAYGGDTQAGLFTVAALRRVAGWRPGTTGEWRVRQLDGTTWTAAQGTTNDIPAPADYLGTGKAQHAVYRPSTGQWIIRADDGSTVTIPYGGGAGDIPVPGDYFGVGYAVPAVYAPAAGKWFLRRPDGVSLEVIFGLPTDKPVPADYLGRGRVQLAVYRSSDGTWRLLQDDGTVIIVPLGGVSGDVPVPADYFSARRAQPAVFRPGTGQWLIRTDWGTTTTVTLGTTGDVPVPQDYLGLGRAQLAVFRPSNATWYLVHDGFNVPVAFGVGTDVPAPADFVGP